MRHQWKFLSEVQIPARANSSRQGSQAISPVTFWGPFGGSLPSVKLPLQPQGSSTSMTAGKDEADPSRGGEEGQKDPPEGRRWGEEHSQTPQPSRGARPGASPSPRTPPHPAAPRRPHGGRRRSPAPEAPAPRQLRPAAPHRYRGGSTRRRSSRRSALAAATTALLLLQTYRHPAASRRHWLGTAPAPGMLGVVVLRRRLPRPTARRLWGARTTAPESLGGEKAVDGHQQGSS